MPVATATGQEGCRSGGNPEPSGGSHPGHPLLLCAVRHHRDRLWRLGEAKVAGDSRGLSKLSGRRRCGPGIGFGMGGAEVLLYLLALAVGVLAER